MTPHAHGRRTPQRGPRVRTGTHPAGNQRGSVLIMVTLAIFMLFAFAVAAIDAAMMMTTKTQLQNAADAAALAGAVELGKGGNPAQVKTEAMRVSRQNQAVQVDMEPVRIVPNDVQIIDGDKVRVTTHRTQATGDALRTYFLKFVNPGSNNLTDVVAVATARVGEICGVECLKPWAIPDRWDDVNQDGIWDEGEHYDPTDTGYNADQDAGTELVLKHGAPSETIASGQFFPINYPPLGGDQSPMTGANAYRDFIAGCAQFLVRPGDRLQTETGNMVGPTVHGMEELFAKDPNARWNPGTNSVEGSAFGVSPRVVLVPFFDPSMPPVEGRTSVTVTKIGAFFLEKQVGGGGNSQVFGRFMKVATPGEFCQNGSTAGSFLFGLALVE